jgi:drug/metabolite transporter (DMT)-like permease
MPRLIGQLRLHRLWDLALFILFGLLAKSLFNASYFLAVESGGVTLATVMLYTAPAFVAVFANFLFGKRLSFHKITLIGLTLMGTIPISLAQDEQIQFVSKAALCMNHLSKETHPANRLSKVNDEIGKN